MLRATGIGVVLLAAGVCAYLGYDASRRGERYVGGPPTVPAGDGTRGGVETDPAAVARLMNQIVDSEGKEEFTERAVIEGKAFAYFLKRVSTLTAEGIRKTVDDRLTFENLQDDPDMHRGEAYTPGRGVIVEIARAELTPEFGFPEGWSVLPGVFVNTAKEVHGVRFICAPGSTLYEKLRKGIDDDALPVILVSGLFFKNYARKTGDEKEPPWVRPLLICPEPEFPLNVEPRHVLKELQEAGYGHLLPSQRIEAPRTQERLVLEASLVDKSKTDIELSCDGESAGKDRKAFLEKVTGAFLKRLPKDAEKPAGVILVRGMLADAAPLMELKEQLKQLGLARIAVKEDFRPQTGGAGAAGAKENGK